MSWVLWGVLGIGVLGLILFLLDREIYFYEGKHLGRRIGPKVQAWLYDQWARKYDQDKRDSQADDAMVLARPLLAALGTAGRDQAALVLDVATGTGRLPQALFGVPEFQGHVIGLDISPEMLVQAARKLAPHRHRVTLIRHSAVPLPFLDDTFEAVSCLEALEIMPYADQATAELVRVLKPGGVLLTTRGAETSGRTHAIRSVEAFTGLLESVGFERIDITPWWKNFDRVLAFKPGVAQPPRMRGLPEFLCCPRCGQPQIADAGPHLLRCAICRAQLPVTAEGIIVG